MLGPPPSPNLSLSYLRLSYLACFIPTPGNPGDGKYISTLSSRLKNQQSLQWNNQQNVYSTMYSQAVTHPSTNMAQCCLTSVIRRELVFSTWYGRRQMRVTHLTCSFTFWGLKLMVPFMWILVQVIIVEVVCRTKQSKLDSLLKEVCIHYNSLPEL